MPGREQGFKKKKSRIRSHDTYSCSMRQTNRKKENPWKQQIGEITIKKKESQPTCLPFSSLSLSILTNRPTKSVFFFKPLLVIITRIRGITGFLLTSLCFFFNSPFPFFAPLMHPFAAKFSKTMMEQSKMPATQGPFYCTSQLARAVSGQSEKKENAQTKTTESTIINTSSYDLHYEMNKSPKHGHCYSNHKSNNIKKNRCFSPFL